MRSLVGTLLNNAPVPYTPRRVMGGGLFSRTAGSGDREAQAAQYGANGTLFAIVSGIALDVSGATWRLWRKAKSGKKEDRVEVTSHAALDLWHNPNPFMPGQEYREVVQQHLDLTGEGWNLLSRGGVVDWPLEMWPVFPHRMYVVPDPEKFIAGYLYLSPDGEKVPLEVRDVRLLRQPHPLDMMRGLGVVQAISVDLDTAKAARRWNRDFFLNSAEPGGVIQIDKRLDDTEFDEMTMRWREQHQGTANAHRVALLEHGATWVERRYTQKDMQFAELLNVSREAIREAYRYPVAMLGESKDVNRAVAAAQRAIYAESIVVPRLDRWKGFANSEFLPAFGATSKDLEFDYDSPVPEDEAAENAARDSKATAAKTYVDAGWDPDSVKEGLDLPAALVYKERPAPPVPPPPPAGSTPGDASATTTAAVAANAAAEAVARVFAEWGGDRRPKGEPGMSGSHLGRRPLNAAEQAAAIDLEDVQGDWEHAVDRLVGDWPDLTLAQRESIYAQVRTAVLAGNPVALAGMTVPTADTAAAITAASQDMAMTAADRMVEEAGRQGVRVEAGIVGHSVISDASTATARVLGNGLASAAGREALRVYRPGIDPAKQVDAVVGQVKTHLEGLSDARLRDDLGGTLTLAQNLGRLSTLESAPKATYRASEVLDTHTCKPCADIDEKVLPTLEAAHLAYGPGYLYCLGGVRCRGTFVAVWDEQARTEAPTPDKPAVPDEAKPFHRDLGGLEEISKTVGEVRAADEAGSGVRWAKLGGGQSADTRLATLDDGRQVVHKRAPEWGDPDAPRTQAGAEQLASLLARALDVPAPAVYRTEADAIWMDWAPGKTVGELADEADAARSGEVWRAQYADLLACEQALRMGLLDVLAGNSDRNSGNIVIDASGRMAGIDHGSSWNWAGVTGHERPDPGDFGPLGSHRPIDHYLFDNDHPKWKDNPLTASDVKEIRKRLKRLRADFRKVGREKWLDWSLRVLDELARHATGTTPLYG